MRLFFAWLPLAFVTTILCGLVEIAVQQNMRQTANNLPARVVEDAVYQLHHGVSPKEIVGTASVDLETSLNPFVMIEDGTSITTSAILDGTPLLSPPHGVLQAAQSQGENRITWQPRPGIRQAIVVRYIPGPSPVYVLAGQSLREVEKHQKSLLNQVLAAWIIAMVGSFALMFFTKKHR